ncbi:MAG: NAD(P)/FAD-dependent oxidoreductase [Bacteroidota bacterium]
MEAFDVVIIGGGLAGLTAALHLKEKGHNVLVCEKQPYPHHKVCGEYVSNEVVPYLRRLGIPLDTSNSVSIDTLKISTTTGKALETTLPLGAKGVSRYFLDNLLYEKGKSLGVAFKEVTVTAIEFKGDCFEIALGSHASLKARIAIGAFGKRSNLDKHLQRPFIQEKSSWLGVKAHYQYDGFPENQVALHSFDGGYGGLSKTESGAVNFCYLAHYGTFKKQKSIADFNETVVSKNPFLNRFLEKAVPLFSEPLAIAQVSFAKKEAVTNHILMCGDSAGLIHPLCGNGMAMAIHAAKLASEQIHAYLENPKHTRGQMETAYQKLWQKNFGQRLRMGRWLQRLLLNPRFSNLALRTITKSPYLVQNIIRQTHGAPIT